MEREARAYSSRQSFLRTCFGSVKRESTGKFLTNMFWFTKKGIKYLLKLPKKKEKRMREIKLKQSNYVVEIQHPSSGKTYKRA